MTTKALVRLPATLVALAGVEAALLTAGRGRLAGPDLADPASWPTWVLTRPPDVAVMAFVRWAGLALGAYLLVATALGGLARTTGSQTLIRATDRVTPRSVRRFLDRMTGMAAASAVVVGGFAGMTASTGVAAADPAGGPPTTRQGPPITLRGQAGPRADPLPTTTTAVSPPTPGPVAGDPVPAPPRTPSARGDDVTDVLPPATVPSPPPPADGRPSTPDPRAAAGTPWSPGNGPTAVPGPSTPPNGPHHNAASPAAPQSADGTAPAPSGPPVDADTWTVQPGDHFWSIAERVLADRWQRPPTLAEIDGYWRVLIAGNRTRLADRDNPDLLFPGQILTLPAVPVRPAA